LAALDAATGLATDWNPSLVQGDVYYPYVYAVATLGNQVFAGGDFGSAGGRPRYGFVALDAHSAAATEWDPGADGYAWSLLPEGDTLYVGGRFTQLGGIPRASLAAVQLSRSLSSGAAPPQTRVTAAAIKSIEPNPIHGEGTVRFALSEASEVRVALYDVQGRLVMDLLDRGQLMPGEFELPIRGAALPPGAYLCRLEAGANSVTRRVVVLR
jgi:hypothetical protein